MFGGRGRCRFDIDALARIDPQRLDAAAAQRLQVGAVCEQEFAAPEGMIEPAAVQPMDVHAEAELADKDFSEQGGPRLERRAVPYRSEENTSELQSQMRISS